VNEGGDVDRTTEGVIGCFGCLVLCCCCCCCCARVPQNLSAFRVWLRSGGFGLQRSGVHVHVQVQLSGSSMGGREEWVVGEHALSG
jgi:hypothetical protein